MNKPKKFEDMDCEDLRPFCPWEGAPVFCYGGDPVMCEGRYCEEAYEVYLEGFDESEE